MLRSIEEWIIEGAGDGACRKFIGGPDINQKITVIQCLPHRDLWDAAFKEEIEEMTQWIVENLGSDVPLHFTAFHPDWKMMDTPKTPKETLVRCRKIAIKNGIRYAYTGNVHDFDGASTYCHNCNNILIGRDWHQLSDWNLSFEGNYSGNCKSCGTLVAGVFDGPPGNWGRKRIPLRFEKSQK